ncbi:MAG TPA: GTP-binding protein [Candidatus Aquilonibacter sp.]
MIVASAEKVATLSPLSARERPLRFLMAGSVDDGKSTLTGRLLFDAQAILSDQLDKLMRDNADAVDFSMLTDGLEAEREQGITIDVAYRYFSTPIRKFIIADAPGHEQYTRNMVTAAAGSDAAVVLVDITKLDFSAAPVTLLPQTRRHTLLAQMLRVPRVIFAVNKIDAVENPQKCFFAVREALLDFASRAGMSVAAIIPISALHGDNVSLPGSTSWYDGPTLLHVLESLPVELQGASLSFLMPVQYVSRDTSRVLWGRVARGTVSVGDRIQVFPSNEEAVVREIRTQSETERHHGAGRSVGLVLDREIDVTRGDWISTPHFVSSSKRFCASAAWLDTESAQVGRKYLLRHGSRYVQGKLIMIESTVEISTLDRTESRALAVNDIGTVVFETQTPLPLEPYRDNREAGSLIVIDPATNRTSGVLLVDRLRWDFGSADVRAGGRVAREFAVRVTLDGETFGATAEDSSAGGMRLWSEDVMMAGSDVELHFMLPDNRASTIDARATVLAHEPSGLGYRYHVAFFGLDPAMHGRLLSFVRGSH